MNGNFLQPGAQVPSSIHAVRMADGFIFVARNGTDDFLATGVHEEGLRETLYEYARQVAPGQVIVVAGAHVGAWAIRLAQFAPVIAYEANFDTWQTLVQNVSLNDVKVDCRNEALWDAPGQLVTMVTVGGKLESGSTHAEPVDIPQASEHPDPIANTTTLDIDCNRSVGLILCDTEGAEARVLRGAFRHLKEDRPTLLIELHEGHPGVDADIRDQVRRELDLHAYTHRSLPVVNEEFVIGEPAEREKQLDFELEIIEHPQDDLTGEEAAAELIAQARQDMSWRNG